MSRHVFLLLRNGRPTAKAFTVEESAWSLAEHLQERADAKRAERIAKQGGCAHGVPKFTYGVKRAMVVL